MMDSFIWRKDLRMSNFHRVIKFILIICIVILLPGCTKKSQDNPQNEDAVIYWEEGEQVSSLPDGINWNEKEILYVASMFTNEILVFDIQDDYKLMGSIPVGKRPFHLILTPDMETLFVSCALLNEVWEISTSNQKVVSKIRIGERPAHLAFSGKDNRQLLYVSILEESAVAVVDLNSKSVVDKITVGEEPYDLVLGDNDNLLYVTNFGDDSISIVDLNKRVEINRIPAGDGPAGLVVSEDSSFMFSGAHGYTNEWWEIWKYDLSTGEVVEIFETDPEDPMPAILMKQPQTDLIWALIDLAYTVYVIDQNTFELKQKITVGRSPQEIDFTPDGLYAFVVNTNEDTFSVVDGISYEVLGTYPAGQVPTDVVYKPGKIINNP
jgi:YVTN family beta-propeller protein